MHWSGRAAPCFQRLRPAKAAAPGVEQNWEGGMKKMAVCTGRAFYLTPPPLAALCSPALLPESLGPCANGCSVSFPLRQATCWEKRGAWPSPRGHPKKLGGGLKGQRGCALSQPGGPRLSLGVPGVGLLLSVTQLVGVGGG